MFSPRYFQYLVRCFVTKSHTVLVLRSLHDISVNADIAIKTLTEVNRLDCIQDIFIADISEQTPFIDYSQSLRDYYSLTDTGRQLHLRVPETFLVKADALQTAGLSYRDINDVMMTTKSHIHFYRRSKGFDEAESLLFRKSLSDTQRSELRAEGAAFIKAEFGKMFSLKKADF